MTQRGKVTFILFFLAVCATAALIRHYANRNPWQTKPSVLYAVVYEQLNAFRTDDFGSAYSRASMALQNHFTTGQFAKMIRNDYAGIISAQRVEFGIAKCRGAHAFIQVFFIDRRGEVTPCVYSLVFEGGRWKIDGAHVMHDWPTGMRLTGIRN